MLCPSGSSVTLAPGFLLGWATALPAGCGQAINHHPNPALAGGGRRRRGIPRKSGCPLSASADPSPKAMSWAMGLHLAGGCLASSSPHGGCLRAQGQSWNLGWQEVGPAGRPAREARERGQREMPRTPSWVAVIPRLIWGPWIFPMRKGNWSWRAGPLGALVDFETQHLVMCFSYDL